MIHFVEKSEIKSKKQIIFRIKSLIFGKKGGIIRVFKGGVLCRYK